VAWAVRMAELGAGEILLTSMDRDGTRNGFELGVTRAITDAVDIPVIASGGVGTLDHLVDGITLGGADAVLAASIFHFGEYTIRQAKETNNRLKKDVEDARLRIHAEVIEWWAQLQSTASQIKSAQDALEANRIALEGVIEEEKVGQRTTLDVLNAQLEYLGSQIQLVTAKRDRVVAEYTLYSSVGRLDAQSLGLSVPFYDPFEHYNIVKNKWFGLRPPPPPAPDE